MVLVAAVAIGTAMARPLLGWRKGYPGNLVELIGVGPVYLAPWLAAFTIAVAALRLKRPRPPLAIAFQTPGMAGCLAAALGLVYTLAVRGWPTARAQGWRGEDFSEWMYNAWYLAGFQVGLSVAGFWAFLALADHWRRDRGWLDRMGRAAGVGWIVILTLMAAGNLLS
jgi:hypothetical protein